MNITTKKVLNYVPYLLAGSKIIIKSPAIFLNSEGKSFCTKQNLFKQNCNLYSILDQEYGGKNLIITIL